MCSTGLQRIIDGLQTGEVVPYLGPGVLEGMVHGATGQSMPIEDEDLILALTRGQRLSNRLMADFPRAAMHVELKKGRKAVNAFLTDLYGASSWSGGGFHAWLASFGLPYLIDTNRDICLQQLLAGRAHTLIVGIARILGNDYRYRIWTSDGLGYREICAEQIDVRLPILFKPLGTPLPEPNYVASDADYVDYITELMGGFAVPAPVKKLRVGKRYLVVGLRLSRDTERMLLTDLLADANPELGWALIQQPTAKERRYCERLGLEIVNAPWPELLECSASARIPQDA